MAVLTLTINTPAVAFVSKQAEVAWLERTLRVAATEIRGGTGTRMSGSIIGGVPNVAASPAASLGSWTYTATATNP